MLLQQSPTFERKQDGDIDIQCSVCFFSGFSKCHCRSSSASKDATVIEKSNQQQLKSSSANGSSRSANNPRSSKAGDPFPLLHPATIAPYDNVPSLSIGNTVDVVYSEAFQ
jgi:hypothetical protein